MEIEVMIFRKEIYDRYNRDLWGVNPYEYNLKDENSWVNETDGKKVYFLDNDTIGVSEDGYFVLRMYCEEYKEDK